MVHTGSDPVHLDFGVMEDTTDGFDSICNMYDYIYVGPDIYDSTSSAYRSPAYIRPYYIGLLQRWPIYRGLYIYVYRCTATHYTSTHYHIP